MLPAHVPSNSPRVVPWNLEEVVEKMKVLGEEVTREARNISVLSSLEEGKTNESAILCKHARHICTLWQVTHILSSTLSNLDLCTLHDCIFHTVCIILLTTGLYLILPLKINWMPSKLETSHLNMCTNNKI